MKRILQLIANYQNAVQHGVQALQTEFKSTELLRAWRSKSIPQYGKLPSDVEWQFHGIGCLIIIDNITVDFNFGPNHRHDGFDLWRLGSFVQGNPLMCSEYFDDRNLLETDFNDLIKRKVIVKIDDSSWYYFAKS